MITSKLPKDLNLYQTSKCNYTCPFCIRATKRMPKVPDISVGLVEKIFQKFPITTCCIAGFGEPLMSEGVFDVVSVLNTKGISPSIITNGSLIKDRFSEIEKAKLLYVNVSLNSAIRSRYERITGTLCLDDVLLGIKMLVDLKKFMVTVSMIVFRDNYTEIPDFLELADSLGVERALLINSLPYSTKSAEGILTEKDIKIVEAIDRYRDGFKGKVLVSRPRYLKDIPDHCCNSPWTSIGVDGNGSITGCRRVHGPSNVFGNIEDKDIWNNLYMLNLRVSARGLGYSSWYCDRCFGNVH